MFSASVLTVVGSVGDMGRQYHKRVMNGYRRPRRDKGLKRVRTVSKDKLTGAASFVPNDTKRREDVVV